MLNALHEAGAGLMLGADALQIFNPPGFAAHRELNLLIDAGLTTYEVLKTDTVNVADYLGETGSSGIIVPGARADLLLLTVNPLEIVPFQSKIEGVVSEGRYYDRDRLDEMLEGVSDVLSNSKNWGIADSILHICTHNLIGPLYFLNILRYHFTLSYIYNGFTGFTLGVDKHRGADSV